MLHVGWRDVSPPWSFWVKVESSFLHQAQVGGCLWTWWSRSFLPSAGVVEGTAAVCWATAGLDLFFAGYLFGLCCRSCSILATSSTRSPIRWERLAARALHFYRHRRLLSFAFGQLGQSSLTSSERARPTHARLRRRANTPRPSVPVLHEVPALGPHGSNLDHAFQ